MCFSLNFIATTPLIQPSQPSESVQLQSELIIEEPELVRTDSNANVVQLGSVGTGADPNVQNEPRVVLIDKILLLILGFGYCIVHFAYCILLLH